MRARRDWVDVALAAGAVALSASVLASIAWPGPVAVALVLAHTVPVAFRRRAPRAAFAVSVAAGAAYVALGWPMVGLGLAALVMTYSLAAYTSRRDSLVGLAAVEASLAVAATTGTANARFETFAANLLVLAAAWVLGDGARRRREEAWADQRRLARQAVADERLRIARELHDVVAHSMSVIAVQAGTGRMVLDDDVAPGARLRSEDIEHARRALRSIEDTSRQALAEMRRLLGVLRAEDGSGADGAALAPVPTLDDLDRLVAHAVEGGTPVDVVVDGDRGRAPAGIELAAFRVLQEALTNVRRHAPGAPARVHLAFGADDLVVEVENPLTDGQPTGRRGLGLVGMRERVSLYGGAFEAGPRPGGTFRVSARIPYTAEGR